MRGLGVGVLALCVAVQGIAAQAPEGASTLSVAAVADSQKVLTTLERTVRTTPRDAAAWHRLGRVAWVLAERAWAEPRVTGLVPESMYERADAALRRAAELAPDELSYRVTLAGYIADRMGRVATPVMVRYADELLQLLPDSAGVAFNTDAALKVGKGLWNSYETMAHRRISREPNADTLRNVTQLLGRLGGFDFQVGTVPLPSEFYHAITQLIFNTTEQPFEVAGEATYLRAQQYLRTAYDLSPTDRRTYRALATLYLGRDRWTELVLLARDHTQRVPADPWGWMGLGLGLARTMDIAGARDALTTGLATLNPAERRMLDRMERISSPQEVAQLASLDSVSRERTIAAQWFLADPLWSTDDEDPRLEFLARIAYAELRWGTPESNALGVDTDRGRVFLRYGPPDVIARLTYDPAGTRIAGRALAGDEIVDIFERRNTSIGTGREGGGGTQITLYWVYDSGLLFAFANLRRLAFEDFELNNYIFETRPARFDNIAVMQIDSMPTQLVRFRAGADSVELFVATRAPVEQMRALAAEGTTLSANNWVYGRTVPDAFRETLPVTDDGVLRWTRRLRAGDYLWRVETTAPGLLAAGRATSPLTLRDDAATGFTMRGAGISDLLLGTALTDVRGAESWRDANVTPLIGPLRGQRTVALVWETYDLASDAGTSRYDVVVQVQRVRGRADRIVASVVGALASVAGIDRNAEGVAIRYARTAPAAPVIVEQLTIDLGDTPPGEYIINVEVRDTVSGRVLTRATRITIE